MWQQLFLIMLLWLLLCEKSRQSITVGGGKFAGQVEFPFMVSIQYRTDSGELQHFCGGSIISRQNILTAAHCLYSKGELISLNRVRVVYGNSNLQDTNLLETSISNILIHPNYSRETNRNDIAILSTSDELEINNSSTRIALLESNTIPNGLKMIVAGWGFYNEKQESFSSSLRRARIPLTSLINCNGMGLRASHPNQFCAGDGGGADTCIGDSGGPLFRFEGSLDFALIGIISYGKDVKCGSMNSLTVYTNISNYNNFIRNSVQNATFSSFDPNANYNRALLNEAPKYLHWKMVVSLSFLLISLTFS